MKQTIIQMECHYQNNIIAINNLIRRYGPDHEDVTYYKDYNQILKQIIAQRKCLDRPSN